MIDPIFYLSAMLQGRQRMAGGNPAGFGKKRGHFKDPLRSGWTGNPVERDGPPGPREQAKKRQREISKRGGA